MPSQAFLNLLETLKAQPDRAGQPIEDLRTMGMAKANAIPLPRDLDTTPVEAGGVPAEWVEVGKKARRKKNDSVLLYFHGGAYFRGSTHTVREMCGRLARAAEIPVLSVDYRVAPENPFPAAVEDALAAYRWLQTQGYAPGRIAVGGDSAGGGLACALLLGTRDYGALQPGAAVLLSPWVDLTQSGESMDSRAAEDPSLSRAYLDRFAGLYLNEQDAKDPLASPLFGDLAGLAPMFIQAGTAEVLLDDAIRLAEKVRLAGGEAELDIWEGMTHVWQNFGPDIPEGSEAVERAGAWLKARLG